MGRLDNPRNWLRRALAVAAKPGSKKSFKLMALCDPDLEPVWKQITELGR